MNLLIIGAGGHGKVVAEIAVDCGYEKIDFLDDNSSDAVGKISDLGKFVDRYECAFVGIGNNRFRGELIKKLENCGYQVPVLIHPTAYVSRSAQIEKGTVVEPKTIVNANTKVSLGCIISAGAIVDHDVVIGQCCHINTGAIVMAGATVEEYTKLEAGEVKLGYQQVVVKK
jgi:sugar O-acyltransferase (sialic acid O-acetyltransferase NeuD family)